ncbi:MAG: hypothetical protein OXD42_07210, partial [Rhodospirillaceae bacterium]|nr:hypothetical protein [Rhodospirillaceae bacterium]
QQHHIVNVRRLIDDKVRSGTIIDALLEDSPEKVFAGRDLAILRYVRALTLNVQGIDKALVDVLRAEGCDDGQILEVNQVCSYFNYANRLLNGLGVSTEGDVIGYYSDDAAEEGV